ncbi:MAG TPA: outer membrane beta-barrel protein [Candidatus Saccharimonadales bacterium]|nr:outer membrane beta-barrel protein [Candidatus Saccharimonadales bacterium]
MKLKLILITVLAFGSMAHAQGIVSNISIGAGFQGVFPAGTFTKNTIEANGAANTQSTTSSVGAVADARYDFGRHSAVGLAVTINRSSELFFQGNSFNGFNGGTFTRVLSNNSEIIGTYIFRLPSNDRVKPYAMFGGGLVHYSPVDGGFDTGSNPSSDTKAAFAYGFGTDLKFSDHWAIRLQYRGLVRTEPDFKLTSEFGTQLHTHVAEPSVQLVYHF